MSDEAKQRIQIALVLAVVVAGLRAGYILYRRHEDNLALQAQQKALTPIKYKGNIDLVAKYYDKLADAIGNDEQ